ncbi:ribonuclease H-like domain-containing protein [Tanacetum coccineum]
MYIEDGVTFIAISSLTFLAKDLQYSKEVSGRAIDLEEIQDEDTLAKFLWRLMGEKYSLGDLNEPNSYKAAILDSESNKWIDVMNAKIQSMMDNMIWVLVDLPPGCKTVRSKWIFKKKTDMDGIDKILRDIQWIIPNVVISPCKKYLELNKNKVLDKPKEVEAYAKMYLCFGCGFLLCMRRCTRAGGCVSAQYKQACFNRSLGKVMDANVGFEIDLDVMKSLTGFVSFCSDRYYIHGVPNATRSSTSAPLTPEELKVDKIVLSWIFTTLSDPLQARLVVERPKSAKEAWDLISDIVKDNKGSRTNALTAELQSIKLGDLSMESYFCKTESVVTILTSLDAHVNNEDVIHYALEGLPATYDQVCCYMHYKDTFLDLKTAHVNYRRDAVEVQVSISTCGFIVRFSYGAYGRFSSKITGNQTDELLSKLLNKLGVHDTANDTGCNKNNNIVPIVPSSIVSGPTIPSAYHTGLVNPIVYPHVAQQLPGLVVPYAQQPTLPLTNPTVQQTVTGPPGPILNSAISQGYLGQETQFPNAFMAGTLHDPTTGMCNMDSGHSILATPSRFFHLNNVLITSHIVKNLISVRENNYTVEFDAFCFSIKDFLTRRVLLRCDSTGDLYPVTSPSLVPQAFLVSLHTWHQRLGHPGSDVLRPLSCLSAWQALEASIC